MEAFIYRQQQKVSHQLGWRRRILTAEQLLSQFKLVDDLGWSVESLGTQSHNCGVKWAYGRRFET